MSYFKQFGGKITKQEKERLSRSKHWTGQKFENLQETSMDINPRTLPGLLKKQFTNTENRSPKQDLSILPFDKAPFLADSANPKFIWYGHSVILLRIDGKTILFDPMFGEDASPIAPVRTQRFSKGTLQILRTLPAIDIVLMSHDHYDHLDMESIQLLHKKVNHFVVPLGIGRHLKAWGVERSKIQELDWWESVLFDKLVIEFTPSRHFTGRGLTDRAKCLWGGFVFKTAKHQLFISGDGGYGSHFKQIQEKHGIFDFAFVECGQYNTEWHQIHMYPEESVQAAIDVKTKVAMPIHWGAFKLALHDWKEPVEQFVHASKEKNVKICTPRLGEIVEINTSYPTKVWWEEYE